MAGTYYFLTSTSAIAYDYDDSNRTTRNTSKDRNIRTILSGIRNVDMNGGTATDNRIALLNHNDRKLYILDHNWSRISAEDVTLHSGKTYRAVCATNNRWVVTNITDQRLEFWDFSGSEQTGERQSLGTDAYNGLFSDGTYIYLVNDTDDSVERRTYTNARLSTFISNLGTGSWRGGTSTPSRFLVVNDTSDRGVFYNHSGSLQSSEGINLGANNYDAVMAVEESAATLTLSTTDTDIRPDEQVNINIVSDIDISDFAATDITVRGGTRGTLTRTDARNYVLSVTAGSSAGTMTVSIAEDVVSPGNAAVSQNFTINPNPVVASDLVVSITGTTNIVQFQRTTLTAAVTDADTNAITSGLTYAWTASRGRFIGATDEASAVYEANFTDSSDVEATITCAVTLAADAMPTSDGASLTALSDIGVTGVLVNMFMTALGPVSSNANNALYQDGSVGTLDSGSDQQLDTNIKIWRVRWNNDSNRIILNNNQTGSLQTYFTTNTDKSLYVVFEDGTYIELPQSALVSTGTTWAQWSVTDANIVAKLNALTTTSDLTIGIADADSIGFDANSGSGTATVTATPIPTPAAPANFAETHTHNSAMLSWTSLAGETYEVRQGSNAWSDATSPHTVSGLSPSTAYTFQVRVKAKGRTPAGDAASINLTTNAAPLIAPSVPGNLAATVIDHDTVRLTFSASTGTVTQYQYRYATSSGALSGTSWSDGGTGTTINVDGLSPSTQYYFQVRACNQTAYSAATSAVTATTQAAPLPAPSTPGSLSAAAVDHDTIRLTFTASTGTVTQYQYKVATTQAGLGSAVWTDGGTGTTIDVDGLTPSTQYYFQIRALNQTVGSAATSAVTATTQAAPLVAPSVPGSLAAAAIDHDTVRLTFTASTGTVTQYQYKVATSEVGLASVTWNDGGTGTTITVDGLSPSTQYFFQVRACNQTVYSSASNTANATTQERSVLPPGDLTIESIDEQFIPLGTRNYELSILINRQNVDARVGGLQEGFYQTFERLDDGSSQIKIKSDEVTRLLGEAVWRIDVRDLDDDTTAFSEIIYHVVPVTPILIDPGPQTIYKGVPFQLNVEVRNDPSVQRATSELVGLKSESVSVDEKTFIQSKGRLPLGVELTFDRFDADYYVENTGGSDALSVPFTIQEPTFRVSAIAGAVRSGRLSIYEIGERVSAAGSITSGITNGRRVAMSGALVATLSNEGIKVFDTDDNNSQVGSTITLPTSGRDWSSISMSGNRNCC